MSVLVKEAPELRRRARVLAVLLFLVSCVAVVSCVVLATGDVTSATPPAAARRHVLGLPVVTVERSLATEGTSASLTLHWGALVLLAGPPAAALLVGWVLQRRRPSSADA